MKVVNRYEDYEDAQFDLIISDIKHGKIKAGRLAHQLKYKKKENKHGKKD